MILENGRKLGEKTSVNDAKDFTKEEKEEVKKE